MDRRIDEDGREELILPDIYEHPYGTAIAIRYKNRYGEIAESRFEPIKLMLPSSRTYVRVWAKTHAQTNKQVFDISGE